MEGHYSELARKTAFTGAFTTPHVRGGGAGGALIILNITVAPVGLNMDLYFVERVSGVAVRVDNLNCPGAAPFAYGFGPGAGIPSGDDYFGREMIMPYEWYLVITTGDVSSYIISAEIYD